MPAANPEQVFFHFDFVRSLQMHRRMAMGILIAAVVLSLGYMAMRWNTYKGESLVYVQPSPHRVIENGPAQQWPYDANTYESYIQQQVNDVTRPDVLASAVKRLPAWRKSGESEQAAAVRLGSNIEVTRLGTAYEVSIVATAGSANEAAQIANAVAASFIENATREQRAGDPQRIELLKEERERIQKELASDQAEQEDLSRKLGVAGVSGNTPNPIDDQIAQTRAELVRARTANDEAAAKLTAVAGARTSTAAIDAEADQLVAADPGLVSMKTALNKRRSDLISQMANLTPSHPLYKQDAEELAKINTSLDTMTGELRTKAAAEIEQRLKTDLERTSSVEAQLNRQLAQLTGAAGTAAPRLQRSNELTSDIQRLQNRFTVVDEQYRNLTMENNAPGAVYLASAALPPLHAARARVFRNGFIILLAGLVFAVGGALLAYNLDPRIYIAADVERVLGFPPMAQLPDLREVGAGVAEEYMLRLAAAVEHAHQQGLLSSCIFTGVATGAGVTTVSTRVSKMLEAMGRETVLVDAAGLPVARKGENSLHAGTDLVHDPRGSRSTALLQQMHQETDEDTVVVTDTAPLLVSGETEYLARFVDSAIVVIDSGVTTKAQLREVAKTLHRLDVSSVGFVLNRIALENANPAFRQSVQAVEAHLRSHARVFDRPMPKQEPAEGQKPDAERASPFERMWSMVSPPRTEPSLAAQPVSTIEPHPRAQAVLPVQEAVMESEIPQPKPAPDTATPGAAQAGGTKRRVNTDRPHDPARWGLPECGRARIEPIAAANAKQEQPPAAPQPAVEEPAPAVRPARKELRVSPPESGAGLAQGREPGRPAPGEIRSASFNPIAEAASAAAKAVVSAAERIAPQAEKLNLPERPAPANQKQEPNLEIGHRPTIRWTDGQPGKTEECAVRSQTAETENLTPIPRAERLPQPESSSAHLALAVASSEMRSDDLPYSAASRLGGLRNLMSSLGVNNLHKDAEFKKANPEAEPEPGRLSERAVFAQPEAPLELAGGPAPTLLAEVVAAPEIIPPRIANDMVEREREKEMARPVKSPRLSRWDMPDDVETLPSVRGQYRKRR
ncbi:MAG TPA: hypothetical protein VG267_04765 [Terracidiphilus sp.]|jgi:uncharacterized protein involved in exopolysaccharide biosynthesis|nr:hypothetical protein [Terracidiphilus sp.]